jgi:hypothetical protein
LKFALKKRYNNVELIQMFIMNVKLSKSSLTARFLTYLRSSEFRNM